MEGIQLVGSRRGQAQLVQVKTFFLLSKNVMIVDTVLYRAEARGFFEVGQSYAVRVRAVNAAGAGPWSLDSDQLMCRYKSLKPKVTFKGVAAKEVVTFKAGESMSFEVSVGFVIVVATALIFLVQVNIEGEPPAHDIVWSLGGKQLNEAPGTGVTIDNSKEYRSVVTKDDLTRRDIGALTCTATNMEGKGWNIDPYP